MPKRPKTWIVVADGARGRFLKPDREAKKLVPAGPADLVSPQSLQRSRDLKSDKPGRNFRSAGSAVRHALEPPHDYHKLEKHRFTATLAKTLDDACKNGDYVELVVVAPRRSLGELRELMTKRVQACVHTEVAKDLTKETEARLWRRLKPLLSP